MPYVTLFVAGFVDFMCFENECKSHGHNFRHYYLRIKELSLTIFKTLRV